MISYFTLAVYIFCLIGILTFNIIRFHFFFAASFRSKSQRLRPLSPTQEGGEYPSVTIQLPVYNEKYVITRLLEACTRIIYPSDKTEIHVLDDSTDETSQYIDKWIAQQDHEKQKRIRVIRRSDRDGYKGGALQHALPHARGDYIAIFDADFVPPNDFLLNTIPYFKNERVGFVQTRWGYLNEKENGLTKLQAFGLNAFFKYEQLARYTKAYWLSFNGTAGIWRKTCIEDTGGWETDTVAEDLDISCRAQLKGWKYHYLNHVVCPGELPVLAEDLKKQQYRWSKGGAQNIAKHLRSIFKEEIPLTQRILRVFHMGSNFISFFILSVLLLSVPMLYLKQISDIGPWFNIGTFFFLGSLFIIPYYFTASGLDRSKERREFYLVQTFLFISIHTALALQNTMALLSGLFRRQGNNHFHRTPKKGGLRYTHQDWDYLRISRFPWMETCSISYAILGISLAVMWEDYSAIFFHLSLCLGNFIILRYSCLRFQFKWRILGEFKDKGIA
ncbi:MAG: glycosyltransferase [Cytophagales bacterium]|nr:glycosyltransferase [Cytophagales bacterium]